MSGKRGAFTLSVYCVQRLLLGSVTLPIEKTKSLASVVGLLGATCTSRKLSSHLSLPSPLDRQGPQKPVWCLPQLGT